MLEFYTIFYWIKAALVWIGNFFQKHIKNLTYPNIFNGSVY